MSALDELAAKQAITEVIHSFCRGCDRHDWDLIRSCFHEDAYDDHAIFQGNPEELVAWLTGFLGSTFDATVHTVTNVLIHGIPYLALIYWWGQRRGQRFFARGPAPFLALVCRRFEWRSLVS